MESVSQDLAELYREFKPRMEGNLKSNLFEFLDKLDDDADKLVVIRKFISFIIWYKSQVDKGLADEEFMIAGLYPATKQVKEISWEKIIDALNLYEREIHGEPRHESEYVPSGTGSNEFDDLNEEGGE